MFCRRCSCLLAWLQYKMVQYPTLLYTRVPSTMSRRRTCRKGKTDEEVACSKTQKEKMKNHRESDLPVDRVGIQAKRQGLAISRKCPIYESTKHSATSYFCPYWLKVVDKAKINNSGTRLKHRSSMTEAKSSLSRSSRERRYLCLPKRRVQHPMVPKLPLRGNSHWRPREKICKESSITSILRTLKHAPFFACSLCPATILKL